MDMAADAICQSEDTNTHKLERSAFATSPGWIRQRGRHSPSNELSSSDGSEDDEVKPSPRTPKYRLILNSPFSSRSTISYGLIVYAKDTRRWAVIQRKHSVEFLLFIRGMYRLTYLPLLLAQITLKEAAIIRKCLETGPETFKSVFLKDLNLGERELPYALIRMAESRAITLRLLQRLDLSSNDLSWSWPKGRPFFSESPDLLERETPFSCAKREFMEEVEIDLPPPLFISDTYLSTYFHTLTGKNIEARYWIYVIPKEIPIPPPVDHPEVSNRLWASKETCATLIQKSAIFGQVCSIIASLEI